MELEGSKRDAPPLRGVSFFRAIRARFSAAERTADGPLRENPRGADRRGVAQGKTFGEVPGCRFPGHRPIRGELTLRRSGVCIRFAVDAKGHAKGRTPRPRRCLQVSPAEEKVPSRVRDAQKRETRLWKSCTGKAADPWSGADNKCGLAPTHNQARRARSSSLSPTPIGTNTPKSAFWRCCTVAAQGP